MPLSSRIKLALLVWATLEVLAFALVAQWIGVPRTILLGVITSLLGLILLRRAGTSALLKLRARMGDRLVTSADAGTFHDEMLATAGALALLLPGFLSDIVGLALAVPALRAHAMRWVGGSRLVRGARDRSRQGPSTIDLEPDEWRRTEQTRSKPSPRWP